jgi:hypothetical protein
VPEPARASQTLNIRHQHQQQAYWSSNRQEVPRGQFNSLQLPYNLHRHRHPAPSDEPKKPGRPSKKSLDWIASSFAEVDEIFNGLSSVTGMTRMQLIARWLADATGPGSHTTWNTYLKYFAANKETEAARVSADDFTVHSTAFRAKCYAKYQEEVSDWQE